MGNVISSGNPFPSINKRALVASCLASLITYNILWTHVKRTFTPPGVRRLPNPPGLFGAVFGWTSNHQKNSGGATMERLYDEYHANFKAVQMTAGSQSMILLLTVEDTQYVFNEALKYQKGWMTDVIFRHFVGDGLLGTSNEDFHARQRRVLNPAFSTPAVAAMADTVFPVVIHEVISTIVPATDGGPKKQHLVNITEVMNDATLRIVASAAFRPEAVTSRGQDGCSIPDVAGDITSTVNFKWWMLLPFGDRIPTRESRIICDRRKFLTKRVFELAKVCRQESRPKNEWVLFDYMVHSAAMTEENIVDQSLTFLFAGHETTAGTMSWLASLLATNPEVQAKLFEELSGCMALDSMPPVGVLRDCQYLTAVINETLRLFPPGVAFVRFPQGDDVTPSGVFVNKEALVVMSPYALHRSTTIWGESAKLFDPARWLGEQTEEQRQSFLPFITGKRGCIGRQFAMNELAMLTAALVRRYQLAWPTGRPFPTPLRRVTLRPSQDVDVLLRRRVE